MFAWFFPKDFPGLWTGHRYDWEDVVLWFSDEHYTKLILACFSSHSRYICTESPFLADYTHPVAKYYSVWPFDHSLSPGLYGVKSEAYELIDWTYLPQKSKDALETFEFGRAVCPFIDKKGEFHHRLRNAHLDFDAQVLPCHLDGRVQCQKVRHIKV